ncbi:DNA primase [Helcobacillus massiliensis]|uniref:DNA primase n=1 Tax=Helcobacillus massiliensis TaxID=521392 RepID=UPI0021A48BF8|nr:DNA primase [Helcobacillus massiliensis]MCT1557147.1 DNA primase [Helcobacillus massiliensis]MCT2036118.1 DNA primase [Helcobacillus massiliensis]MCT2331249.1 DNA primase [Helcobacillus massiliensis]
MAGGLIRREDIQLVRERSRLDEIVSEHVTLRTAGVGSMKGLCPFHDEKTPSFHIRPALGHWHCFGCGEGGDVIAFVQRISHLSFVEAVEYLATKAGVTLRYEDTGSGGERRTDFASRQRLLEAHRVAEEFYREQLASPEAQTARRFLGERGFDRAAADKFGVGFAPQGWDTLLRHLRGRGFTEKELSVSGLVSQGQRGVYDRFRGRLTWPIRDVTGATIGFGARCLFEDDKGPKYLNTPETPIYKKSQVLYGLDLARRAISTQRQVVVMEGYTDVMAAHLAGIETAVASCGTAFGGDHVTVVRRIMGDTAATAGLRLGSGFGQGGAGLGGEVIFTFDGDEAGQKAALKAFGEDQRFVAQTFVAVEPGGLDPCDVRIQRGDQALRDLIDSRVPMFEFAIRAALKHVDLDTAEGQVAGLRMAAPVVAQIRDKALRPEYARRLSGWLGMDERTVGRAVQDAAKQARHQANEQQLHRHDPTAQQPGASASAHQGAAGEEQPPMEQALRLRDIMPRRDPVGIVEMQSLALMLQSPQVLDPVAVTLLPDEAFRTTALQSIWDCILATASLEDAVTGQLSPARFLDAVMEIAGDTLRPLIVELASLELPARTEEQLVRLGASLMTRLTELSFTHEYSLLRHRLARLDPRTDQEEYTKVMTRMSAIQEQRRALHADDL